MVIPMDRTLLANISDRGLCRIAISGGRIAEVVLLGAENPAEPYCSPGFVDLQINGLQGVDFSAEGLTVDAAVSILPALWKTGVTSFCPTLVTSSLDLLEQNLRTLEAARAAHPEFAASVPCYHLEGPYLSQGPSRGAHNPVFMHDPDWSEFERLQKAAAGHIGILTLAPELAGAEDLIRRAASSGVVVAVGHTDAAAADIHRAVAAGARLSTHLGNGCPELIHRHHSPFWAQLVADDLSASMICDGFHLPSEVVQTIARVKGPERIILITDAVSVTGLAPGEYHLGTIPIRLLPSNQVVMRDQPTKMAGSSLSMNQAIAKFHSLGRVPLAAAVRAASTNPARLLGEGRNITAEVAAGCRADLALWREEQGSLRIEAVYVEGAVRVA